MHFLTIDKEAPVPIYCTEEQEYIAGSPTSMINKKCVFHDNVNGVINGTLNWVFGGASLPSGNSNAFFMARDSEGNNANVDQRYVGYGKLPLSILTKL